MLCLIVVLVSMPKAALDGEVESGVERWAKGKARSERRREIDRRRTVDG